MQQVVNRASLKRLSYLGVVFLVIGAGFLFRLFERQVLEKKTYAEAAAKQYYTKIEEHARRGGIYIQDKDSSDVTDSSKSGLFPIAMDLELFNINAVPKQIEDKTVTAQKISQAIGIDETTILQEINNDKLYVPPLKKKVTKEEADKVAALNLKGIFIEGQYSRFYPENDFLSQVLGFVDYDGNGKYGLEEYYDGVLKGEGGILTGIKDNLGRVFEVKQSEPGKDGASIALTIDRSVQYMAEKKLKEGIERFSADGGTIIIMDPNSGAVLAMASAPSYDPNKFNEISKDNQKIFLNPAASLNWEPGSIFKPVIVAAALADKKVEPDSKPDEIPGGFQNSITVDGYEIHNALDKPYGYETVTQILENSDNIGMVWVANKMENKTIADYLRSFGFGDKTKIDLSGESPGQVIPEKKWRDVNRATISFGQGISTTPIQIISAYAAIANKGNLARPRLLGKIIEPSGQEKAPEAIEPRRVVGEDEAKKLTEMLVSVVVNGHGKKAQVPGFRVAGKTGTAQIPNPSGGYEKDQHIGSFAGFAPADDPKFVMLVKFDKPKNVDWAESSAAPIFGEIADWLLNNYYKVPKS
jgi:cell division protein FtsI/penicillin-binding protein 2